MLIGSDRVKPRSIHALAIAYYDSAAFKALKPITRGVYNETDLKRLVADQKASRFCRMRDLFTRLFTRRRFFGTFPIVKNSRNRCVTGTDAI